LTDYEVVDNRDGDERERFLAHARRALADLYAAWGRPDDAEKWGLERTAPTPD
jgi:hypothetical protein